MEIKEQLTKGDMHSLLSMSKLLSEVSNDFKTYHFTVVDQLEMMKKQKQNKQP